MFQAGPAEGTPKTQFSTIRGGHGDDQDRRA